MLGRILAEARVPASELVEARRSDEVDVPPRPASRSAPPGRTGAGRDKLIGELSSTTTAR